MEAFLFYIDDWQSSKHVQAMDAHEEVGYLWLLMRAAKEDDCTLPDNDAELAILSRLGAQWRKPTRDPEKRIPGLTSGAKIRKCFVSAPAPAESRLVNTRLYREFVRYSDSKKIKQAAGVASGRARKGQQNGNSRSTPVHVLLPKNDEIDEQKANTTATTIGIEVSSLNGSKVSKNFGVESFNKFINSWAPFPVQGKDLGCQIWLGLVADGEINPSNLPEILAGLERWKASRIWAEGKVHAISTWLGWSKDGRPGSRMWMDYPAPAGPQSDAAKDGW